MLLYNFCTIFVSSHRFFTLIWNWDKPCCDVCVPSALSQVSISFAENLSNFARNDGNFSDRFQNWRRPRFHCFFSTWKDTSLKMMAWDNFSSAHWIHDVEFILVTGRKSTFHVLNVCTSLDTLKVSASETDISVNKIRISLLTLTWISIVPLALKRRWLLQWRSRLILQKGKLMQQQREGWEEIFPFFYSSQ